MQTALQAIQQAIEDLGGPAATANKLGVTTQMACFWRDGRPFPWERAPLLERLLFEAGKPQRVEVMCPNEKWTRVADPQWPNPKGRPTCDPEKPMRPPRKRGAHATTEARA